MKVITQDMFGRERPERVIFENLGMDEAIAACVKLNEGLNEHNSEIFHVLANDDHVPLTWEKIYGVEP